MIDITGEVKATDREFHYIMDGMVVQNKHVIKHMSKDIIAKPVFQLLHDWLICDKIDYQMNKQRIMTIATGYISRYKDIFAVNLYPLTAKIKIEEPVLIKERKKYGKFKKAMPKLQRGTRTRRSKSGK
jgi:hypothetical protein